MRCTEFRARTGLTGPAPSGMTIAPLLLLRKTADLTWVSREHVFPPHAELRVSFAAGPTSSWELKPVLPSIRSTQLDKPG
jgi:hypothetical protein